MSTPPPVPPVPDADRYFSATIGTTVMSTVNVPFPVYGDDTDIDVIFNGSALDHSYWAFYSAGAPGTPLASLPRPITDGQIAFTPPLSGGFLEIVGDTRPRQLSMPSAPGIVRREFNQSTGSILSTLREIYRAVKSQKAGAIKFDATGPFVLRSAYDTVSPPFLFLQTDDSQNRPVYFAKLSSSFADWSGPLIAQGPPGSAGTNGTNGTNGANGAYAATDPTTTTSAPTDFIPILQGGSSRRITRDALLASSTPPDRRVAMLWTGDAQGTASLNSTAALTIMADGTARAWGAGNDSGNGDTGGADRWLPKTVLFDPANAVAPTLPFVQAARAGTSMYLLDSAGLVYSCGGNAVGQLGVGNTVARKRFTLISSFQAAGIQIASIVTQPAVWLSSGGSAVYFITTTGLLYGCGINGVGQLGDGTTTNRSTPVRCGTLTNIKKVAAAGDYSAAYSFVMALDTAGNLYSWGDNVYGQLGDGTTTNRSSPYLTRANVADIAVSESASSSGPTRGGFAVLTTTTGTVFSVGLNTYGQLGVGDTTARSSWTQVVGISTAQKVFVGGGYYGQSIVLLSDGTVRAWGFNSPGQAGSASQLTPFNVVGAFQGKVVSAHFHGFYTTAISTALLCSDGTIWVSGDNTAGQLGQANGLAVVGVFTQMVLPPAVTSPVSSIKFVGGYGADAGLVALLADGSMWGTGGNADGRLGTQVGNLHGVDGLERTIFT